MQFFKYCPGAHGKIKIRQLLIIGCDFSCHCAATASPSPSPMADKRISACDRNKRLRQICRRGGACGRPATVFKSVRIRATPCSAVVRPIRERSASRKTPCHSNPEYFDAKSIKPEKFRRTGKFRVGKNRGKGIFQPPEGPENLYNIRNCSYTKYLLSNI